MQRSLSRKIVFFLPIFFFHAGSLRADDELKLQQLSSRLKEIDPNLLKEFEVRLKRSREEVLQFKKGHVVFGQIQLENGQDPRSVWSQMIILRDGYFVDAIGTAGKPFGFSRHGYEPIEVTPNGPGPYEDLGLINMKRVPANRLASLSGRVQLETHPKAPDASQVKLSWHVKVDPVNTPQNGTEGLSPQQESHKSTLAADGTFKETEMSPGKYTLHFTAPGCVQQFRDVHFTAGKTTELAPVRLEVARTMTVEYAATREGDFTNVPFKKIRLKADDRWRASELTPEYAFDLLIGQKDGNLVLDHRYGPCHIEDLGTAKVTDELEVDLDKLESRQPQSVPVKEGHVYVIRQTTWDLWILVRTTEVETNKAHPN